MKKEKEDIEKYAVFVMSLKKSYVKKKRQKNADFPNLRILVRDYSQFQKAQKRRYIDQASELKLKNPKRYKRILNSEEYSYFGNLLEAYQAAYEKLELLHADGRKAEILGESTNCQYNVYCIKLNSDVWEDSKFRKSNPHITDKIIHDKSSPIKGYYVGQTSKPIVERYLEHIDTENLKSTKWGKKYFPRSYDEAYNHELIECFIKESGQSTTGLPHGKSIIVEHQLTIWIRDNNLGAYCA